MNLFLAQLPIPNPANPAMSNSILSMLASLVGAVVFALLWWVDYLQHPARRQEAKALRLVKFMFAIAVLGGVMVAPLVRLYAASRWSDLRAWEGALAVGFVVGVIAPVLVAKILAKAMKTEIPDLTGDKPQ